MTSETRSTIFLAVIIIALSCLLMTLIHRHDRPDQMHRKWLGQRIKVEAKYRAICEVREPIDVVQFEQYIGGMK